MGNPILLIDDEEKFAQMLHDLLSANGYESDFCYNPREAVDRLHQENYELVITDYKMPEMNGAEFLEAARQVNPELPVIMISGLMNMPELIKVANIGVTLVLEKPFKTEDLIEHVSRFVQPSEARENSVPAVEMEVSEIDFQIDDIPVTYPVPASSLSDASSENRRFLEAIWKGANISRHIPFFASRGSEVRLVGEEVLAWANDGPGAPVLRMDLADTKTEFTRSWFLDLEKLPKVIVVDLREIVWEHHRAADLVDWIRFVEQSGKDLSQVRILYVFTTGAGFDPDKLDLEPQFKELLAHECPVLLALRDRLPDIATYIYRFLTAAERASLGRAGALRLLQYSWPKGYHELMARLAKIRAALHGGDFDETSLVSLLKERSDDVASLEGPAELETFLKRRQREYIILHREDGEEMKDTLLRLGVETKDLDFESILADQILIYSELLS